MMSKSRYCMLLLLRAVAGLLSVSGAGIPLKYVCQGDSVQAFQNIEFNNCSANVILQKAGDITKQIAIWSIQNCIPNETILAAEYQGRLSLDQHGNITIHDVSNIDDALYVVISNVDQLPKIYEVQLSCIVAPTTACKPMIEQQGNYLIASVNARDCGKPVVIPYWNDTIGAFNTSEPTLKLISGAETKEYYACIKGVALTCLKNINSHDYCTAYKTEGGKSPPASLVTDYAKVLIAVCITLGILFFVTLTILVIFIRYRLLTSKENLDDNRELLNDDQRQTN